MKWGEGTTLFCLKAAVSDTIHQLAGYLVELGSQTHKPQDEVSEKKKKRRYVGMLPLDLSFHGDKSTRRGFPGGARGKEPGCQCRRHKRHGFEAWVRKIPWSRAWKYMAIHSSILAWRTLLTEERGRPQSTGSQRGGHNRSDTVCIDAEPVEALPQ